MNKLTVKDVDLKGKKVIVRVDFNVPLDEKLNITDARRIREVLPTIKYILDQKAKKVILMSHLGRPEGQVVEDMRLKPVAKKLEQLLKEKVLRLDDCIGDVVKKAIETGDSNMLVDVLTVVESTGAIGIARQAANLEAQRAIAAAQKLPAGPYTLCLTDLAAQLLARQS